MSHSRTQQLRSRQTKNPNNDVRQSWSINPLVNNGGDLTPSFSSSTSYAELLRPSTLDFQQQMSVTSDYNSYSSENCSSSNSSSGATTPQPQQQHQPIVKKKPRKKKMAIDEFEILKVLGKGAYGKVYQVRKVTGVDKDTIYALKSVNKARIIDSRTDTRHTRAERDVLALVDHPFLIKMFYAFESKERLYFVQEFCRGGELFRLMETERMLLEEHALFYLCEIVCALEYLHDLNIVYRDLKTENIMLDSEGHIKLIDFGLSKIFENDVSLTTTFCGTVEYMAPEVVIKNPGHGKPADWWSFGIFMFDLLTGRSPFSSNKGKKETKERILRAKFTIPAFVTPEAMDLIRRLLRKNVDRRLGSNGGADEVKAHGFFKGIDWEKVYKKEYTPPHIPSLNPTDYSDVSQFDPRFTSRTPVESVCKENKVVADPPAVLFKDFDYTAPECLETVGAAAAQDENNRGVVVDSVINLASDMHIRCPGE